MLKNGGTSPMLPMQDNPKKFDCADVEQLAQRYVDNQLSGEERQLFDEHLDYCLPCDKKIQFEFKLKEIVRSKAKVDNPEDRSLSKIKSFLSGLS